MLIFSNCGYECGLYVAPENAKFINYFDKFLGYLSKIFQYLNLNVDFFISLILDLYLFINVIFGIISLGVRFLYYKIHEFKKENSDGMMYLALYISIIPFCIKDFLHFIANTFFESGEKENIIIPKESLIIFICNIQYLLVFVFSLCTSYSEFFLKSNSFIDIDEYEMDDEGESLLVIND